MLHVVAPFDFASPELSEGASTRWRGRIELCDPLVGIEGWALAIDAPQMRLDLELVIGDDALAIVETGDPRPELDLRFAAGGRAGFRFGPEIFARMARLSPHRRGLAVSVRIAGTQTRLMTADGRLPTVAELLDAWRGAVIGRLAEQEPRITRGDQLLARLAALRAEAETLSERPLRPLSENDVGQIDAVHLAAEGQVWFVGWMKRGVELEFPAIVVDRRKYPGGAAILQYERPDLDTSRVGVVGLMDTGWAPAPSMKDGFVYVGRNAQFHLRYGAYTRLLRTEPFLAAYAQVQPVALGGHAEALGSVLHSGSNWMPGNAAAAGIAAEGGVDRLLMLPGFGCLAEGWAVSPAKRVETFHMKIGDCLLSADPASTYFRPRADLQAVFGGGSSVTAQAGFVTALRGGIAANAAGVPLLRIVHDDGTMAIQRVEPKALRRLDPVTDSEEVLRLFPSLRLEPFYPAFLSAVRRLLDERARPPLVLAEAPARRVVVVRLPGEDNNLHLVFDRLARHLADLDPGIGVCLVAEHSRSRSEAMLRLEDLRRASAAPLSLFGVAHGHDILAELPWILDRLGAERFVHVGRGVLLTPEGWAQVPHSLERRGHFIDRFEIVDDTARPDRVDGAVTAAAFGWSTAALMGWSVGAPRFLRGLFGDSGLPVAPVRDRLLRRAAIRIERPAASRLADMIDADLLAGSANLAESEGHPR